MDASLLLNKRSRMVDILDRLVNNYFAKEKRD
jgi:hypothetical protein